MKFKDYHRLIAEVLIEKLKDSGNEQITYGELSKKINGKIIAQGLGRPLGHLNDLCVLNHLPYISIIVYNQENKFKMPSDGFFKEFFPSEDINDTETKNEIYERELKRAITCDCWHKLLNELPVF